MKEIDSMDKKGGEQEPPQEIKHKKSSLYRIIELVCLTVALVTIAWFSVETMNFSLQTSETKRFVEKKSLNSRLSAIIRNGAKLDLVKHTYEVRAYVHPRLFNKMDMNMYYSDRTPLSIVLNDICVDYLSAAPFVEDSLFYSRLLHIIQENQYHNPFDNLEDSQIPFFENVRLIMGDDYDLIQDDMVRISSELSNKNQLVGKYLRRSNISYFISISALVLTIILSFVQLIQGNNTSEHIKHIIAKADSIAIDNEENSNNS